MTAKSSATDPSQQVDREADDEVFVFPASFAQRRLWFLDKLGMGSAYTIGHAGAFRLRGRLDVPTLERSLNEILRRHESLRTTFEAVDGEPVQVIAPEATATFQYVDLEGLPESQRDSEVRSRAALEADRPFDLSRGPLFRTYLMRLSEVDHALLMTVHHIVADGWSMGVLFRELSELYSSFAAGAASPLPELPIQYADFAVWQREQLQGENLARHIDYWKVRLGDPLPVVELPADRARPRIPASRGSRIAVTLSQATTRALNELCRCEGVTPFMTLLTAFDVLLQRHTGLSDVVVGSPIANRNRSETEGLIGFFVNMLVLRTDLSGDPTFRQLVSRVREACLEAYAHQDLPFEKLVEELNPDRDLSRTPLFQVSFALQNAPTHPLELEGLEVGPLEFDSQSVRFDLECHLSAQDGRIEGFFVYNTDLFDPATIARIGAHYRALIEAFVADPDRRLSEVSLLSAAERRTLLVDWNATRTPYPRDRSIQEVFAEVVGRAPDGVAVECGDERLTYAELDARANQLAHHLAKRGVHPGDLVGLCLERSLELVVGVLGIVKAGGAYVPLDPEYPRERLAFMLEDTGLPVLLTEQSLLADLPEHRAEVVCVDTDRAAIHSESTAAPAGASSAESLAYLIYTSGSTGQPKGVEIVHRGVVRLVKQTDYVALGDDEVFLQLAPISFDAATFEIWGALLNGARLAVYPGKQLSFRELGVVIQRHGVTTLRLATVLFHQMVTDHVEGLRGVRQLLAGGDVLSVDHVERALQTLDGCTIINGYGPTEGTTYTCCHRMTDPAELGPSVPIGRPIANTQVYILDSHRQPVPVGVVGELYIGGDGLARGYHAAPELTAERFVADPFRPESDARLYRSGDLARYRADGSIEFLGRIDDQVKVRGFRVEPGEIETVLGRHPAVNAAVVVARPDPAGDKRLVAYVVLREEQAPSTGELRDFVAEKLPLHMRPAGFVLVDEMPLTPSGKVDRRALRELEKADFQRDAEFVAPRTKMEAILAQLWQEVLGVEQVGVYDNFFDLGGHSLLVMQVLAKLEDRLGFRVNPGDVFYQNLGQLAAGCELLVDGGTVAEPRSLGRTLLGAVRSVLGRGGRRP